MSNISIKLNLSQFKNVVMDVKGKTGMVKCLVLPIKENQFFEGEKGIYLDITAFELKEKKADRKDTHILKQSLGKEVYEKMSKEEKEKMPIIGSAIYWGTTHSEPEPVKSEELTSAAEIAIPIPGNGADDLPF
jgi:hypothetical protein